MNQSLRFFAALSDAELSKEVEALAAASREQTARLVASLAEFDTRRLYLGMGFPSLFAYCTRHLRLSEHAAYSRIEAARTARRFPVVLELLTKGDITLTTLTVLGRHLTDENHLILLEAARHKTKREIEAQVAEIDPSPELESMLVPLSGGRCRLEVTIPAEGYQALRRLQELMRHVVPNGDPAPIVTRGLLLQLQHVERRLLGEARRPRSAVRASHTRYASAAVRREVWRRDASQCAFIGTNGRCPERTFLELHHVRPFDEGGPATAENLELRCRAHNVYEDARRADAATSSIP